MTKKDIRETRLLIIEDDVVDQMAFRRFIDSQVLPYSYTIVGSVEEARQALETSNYDAVISDFLLGDGTARDLFDLFSNMPFIIVTGSGDEKVAVEVMKSGASDYLIKDNHGGYLTVFPTTLEKAIFRRQADEELTQYRETLEEMVAERTAELKDANNQLEAEILERKQAEQTLRYQAKLLENVSDAVVSTDSSFQILTWNKAAEQLYGWSNKETIGREFGKLVQIEYVGISRDEFLDDFNDNGVWSGEVIQYNKAGEKLVIHGSVSALYNSHGERIGAIGVHRDITDSKRVENELLAYQTHLEALIEERTTALNNQVDESAYLNHALTNLLEDFQSINVTLETTSMRLREANQELEAFTYSVSHDLRAPLRAVDVFSQILLDDFGAELSEDAAGYLQKVSDSAQKMGKLIQDLLDLSRLGRKRLHKTNIDIPELVSEVVQDMALEEDVRNVDINTQKMPNCFGDSTLLKQVFFNLISNAIKFSRHNANARIDVGWQEIEGEGAYFVKDNGVGFDMDYVENLFGVFQRLHSEDQFEGTGVGLAIVKRIVSRHGGRIWAKGNIDQGAVFYFTIPLEESG